jgi:hypothetical protein
MWNPQALSCAPGFVVLPMPSVLYLVYPFFCSYYEANTGDTVTRLSYIPFMCEKTFLCAKEYSKNRETMFKPNTGAGIVSKKTMFKPCQP